MKSIYADIRAQLANGPKYGYELDLTKYRAADIEHVIRIMTEEGDVKFDEKRFAKDMPEAYAEYQYTTAGSRTFLLK